MELLLFNLGIIYIYLWLFLLCFNSQVKDISELSTLMFLILGGAFTVFLFIMFDPIILVSI